MDRILSWDGWVWPGWTWISWTDSWRRPRKELLLNPAIQQQNYFMWLNQIGLKKIEEIPTDSWLSWKRERKSFAKLHFRVFRFHSLLWSCSILEEMWNLGIKIGQKHWILNKCMNFFWKTKNIGFCPYSSVVGAVRCNVCLKSEALTNLVCLQTCSQITCSSAGHS